MSDIGHTHILWECKEINKYRQLKDLCEFSWKHLPLSVQNGLPPALTRWLNQPYWGDNVHGQREEITFEDKKLH